MGDASESSAKRARIEDKGEKRGEPGKKAETEKEKGEHEKSIKEEEGGGHVLVPGEMLQCILSVKQVIFIVCLIF